MTADLPEDNNAEGQNPEGQNPKGQNPKGERIAKMLARAGIGSRRAVERMIEAGLVLLNGKPILTPATIISSTEGITVDGQPVKAIEPPKLWRYHKPPGLITSYHDPEGRRTVFQALPPEMPRVVAVGRLDYSTEGLLLLTNDGGLARFLELPATGWLRRYRVRAFGKASLKFVETVKSGVTIDGVNYGPIEIEIEKEQGDNIWFKVGIREGKNREIRKVFEHYNMTVNRLIRVSYGPFQLSRLPRGGVEAVSPRIFESVLANYLNESGQTADRSEENPDRPKAITPRGKAGWAKAAPKAKKPKYKPRPPREEAEADAPPPRPRRPQRDQNPSGPRPATPRAAEGSRAASGPRAASPRPSSGPRPASAKFDSGPRTAGGHRITSGPKAASGPRTGSGPRPASPRPSSPRPSGPRPSGPRPVLSPRPPRPKG